MQNCKLTMLSFISESSEDHFFIKDPQVDKLPRNVEPVFEHPANRGRNDDVDVRLPRQAPIVLQDAPNFGHPDTGEYGC